MYVCADLHFYHKNVIVYDNRPWPDVESMNRGLIARWNSVITDNDIVFMLGDVGFCGHDRMKECVSQLNGYKILIRGNHDRSRSFEWWEEVGFDEAYNHYVMTIGATTCHLMHEPPEPAAMIPQHFYLYGHVHNHPDYPDWTPQSACVSICRLAGYAPQKIEDIVNGRGFQTIDFSRLPAVDALPADECNPKEDVV